MRKRFGSLDGATLSCSADYVGISGIFLGNKLLLSSLLFIFEEHDGRFKIFYFELERRKWSLCLYVCKLSLHMITIWFMDNCSLFTLTSFAVMDLFTLVLCIANA